MKIGLKYIQVGQGTFENLPIINGGSWNKPSYFPLELGKVLTDNGVEISDYKTISLLYKFVPEGRLFCVAKRIEVRGSQDRSNEALWIFIPAQMEISPEEITNVINQTERMFDDKMNFANSTKFTEAVPDIYRKDFPVSSGLGQSGNMNGTKVGFISCNQQFPLTKIIGYGYQKIFSGFGIIILNTNGIVNQKLDVLNPATFHKEILLRWPKTLPAHITAGQGFSISIDDKSMSAEGIRITDGIHNVKLSQPGYAPITGDIRINVEDDNKPLQFGPEWNNKIWLKSINTARFNVLDQNGRKVTTCTFTSPQSYNMNGQLKPTFTSGETFYVPEKDLGTFELTVSADGYEPVKGTYDLGRNSFINIPIKRKTENVVLETTYDGKQLTIRIEGTGARKLIDKGFEIKNNKLSVLHSNNVSGESYYPHTTPKVQGYAPQNGAKDNSHSKNDGIAVAKLNGRIDQLNGQLEEKRSMVKTLGILSGVLGCAMVVFLILWLVKPGAPKEQIVQGNQIENVNNTVTNATASPTVPETNPDAETDTQYKLDEAIAYLDNDPDNKNYTWNKSEMENYPALRGLWDELNNYEFEKIIARTELINSTRFGKLKEEIDKKINTPNIPTGTFNQKPEDEGIIFLNYINKISSYKAPTNGNKENTNSKREERPQPASAQSSSPAVKTNAGKKAAQESNRNNETEKVNSEKLN